MGFRESLLEEREKEKEDTKSWKVIAKRVLANFFVVLLLGCSAYAVIFVVKRSNRYVNLEFVYYVPIQLSKLTSVWLTTKGRMQTQLGFAKMKLPLLCR